MIGNLGAEYLLYGSSGGLEGGSGQTASGDSGGPTLVSEEGEERILAVTSLGDLDWTFAARADFYRDWIASHAEGNLGVLGDRTAPALSIEYPLPGAAVPASFQVRVVTQDDGVGMGWVALRVDGREVARCEQTCTSLAVNALAAGAHELNVVATDRAGNATEAALSVQVEAAKADDADPSLPESAEGGCRLGPRPGGGAPLVLLLLALLCRRRPA